MMNKKKIFINKGKANPVKIKHKRQNFSTLISRRDRRQAIIIYIRQI